MNLAARGLRDLDSGSQNITDTAELAQVRLQARKVMLKALVFAVVVTAVAVAVAVAV